MPQVSAPQVSAPQVSAPQVSVVIPAYNAARYLGQTLGSVRAQSVGDWEAVVVDDGSTDGTAAIAEGHAREDARVRVLRQANRGGTAARDRGLAETDPRSPFVVYLDHDDVWEPGALATLLAALAAHPGAIAAHGLARFVDADGLPFDAGRAEAWTRDRRAVQGGRLVAWPPDRPTTFAVLAFLNCIWTPGQAIIRRGALEEDARRYPGQSPRSDWDMWLRLTQLGDVAFVDALVLSYRRHDGNMSRLGGVASRRAARREHFAMWRQLVSSPQTPPAYRRVAFQGYCHSALNTSAAFLGRARTALRRGRGADAALAAAHAAHNYLLLLRWGIPLRWAMARGRG